METQIYNKYLSNIEKSLSTGVATEHTHRMALQKLLESAGDGIIVINEPRRIECGAPDLRVQPSTKRKEVRFMVSIRRFLRC